MNLKQLDKEWGSVIRKETKFLNKNLDKQEAKWKEKVAQYVPEQLENTLNKGFCKAFQVIFDKGTTVIEKTFDRKKLEQEYKIKEYAANLKGNEKSVKEFGRGVQGSRLINMAFSTVEGAGMGVLGMGLPDIPLFLSLQLKSIYEIALQYGFSYESPDERLFVLKVMETALLHGNELLEGNQELNDWIEKPYAFGESLENQIQKTSLALSEELLYLKFIQGIPVVGLLGGMSDVVYQKKIGDYAQLKYKRRFLKRQMGEWVD